MNSTEILLDNLKRHFAVNSIRGLALKLDFSVSIILNWSSGRTSPNIKNINDIAYSIGIATYQLLIPNNSFDITTPIWRDTVEKDLLSNIGRLKFEQDIHESSFYRNYKHEYKMSYRTFLRYVNGQNKNINLKKLDILAEIFSVQTFELIESEREI